jgi:hypothetical protein
MAPSTVAEYLASLPPDRRDALGALRKEINRCLPSGYEEGIQFGMISWYVPLAAYPKGYGGNPKVPLVFVGLGSKKNYMALYMTCFYAHPRLSDWFASEYQKSGKKLDMGMGCVRFKTLDHLAVDVVCRTLARVTPAEYSANYQAARDALAKGRAKKPATTKPAAKKPTAKKPAAKKLAAKTSTAKKPAAKKPAAKKAKPKK